MDGGYFDHVLRSYGNLRVDYESFSDHLCDPDERFRTYWYNCPPWQSDPPTEDEKEQFGSYQSFKDALKYLNRFKVREGRLQKIGGEFKQKGVDIRLAVDAVKLASTGKIDRAILVTGDSDFVPVVEGIDGTGVTTTLAFDPSNPIHNSLLSSVDERIEIDEDMLTNHLRD